MFNKMLIVWYNLSSIVLPYISSNKHWINPDDKCQAISVVRAKCYLVKLLMSTGYVRLRDTVVNAAPWLYPLCLSAILINDQLIDMNIASISPYIIAF